MIDWAEVNFIIGTNPDSFIEIKFDKKSVDTENGLKAYMNTLIKAHDVISQFNLRRVIKFWGYEFAGHVYFMLAPSWIKFNPGMAYAGILNQQMDEANMNEDMKDSGEGSLRDSNVLDAGSNMYKIHQMVFKKSTFIKEPQLYSKEIEV